MTYQLTRVASITLEFLAGTDIKEAARTARFWAISHPDKLVSFMFNGAQIIASKIQEENCLAPRSVDEMIEQYRIYCGVVGFCKPREKVLRVLSETCYKPCQPAPHAKTEDCFD